MNKLKFEQDEATLFYKDLISRLDHYFVSNNIQKEGNTLMKFKIVMYFSFVILFYGLLLSSESLFSFFSFYLLLGLSVLLTAFNVSHDAAHGVAVKSKFWNKLLFQLSFQLQGNNAYVWGKNHNESHHLYTNVEGSDIDVLNNPLVRMTDSQERKWYHQFQHLYVPFLYLLYSLNWFLFRELLMAFNYTSRTIKVQMPVSEIINLIVFKIIYLLYMIVIPAFILPFELKYILIAFLLNHFMISLIFVSVLGVSHLSDFVHHPQPDEGNKLNMSWPKLQMITSIDYNTESKFFNWTLGGFNAHALHHLLPNISHIHYLKILPIFRQTCADHNIVYMEMPYGAAFRSHFRFLQKMGNQDHYTPKQFER